MARRGVWHRVTSWVSRRWRGLFGVRRLVPTIEVGGARDMARFGPAIVEKGALESNYLVDPAELRDLVAKNPEARYGLALIASEIAGREVKLSAYDKKGERYDLPDDHPALVFLKERILGYTLQKYVERQVINYHFGAFTAEIRGRPSPIAPDVALLIPHDPEDVAPKVSDDETTLLGFRIQPGSGSERLVGADRMVFGSIAPVLGGLDRFTGVSPFYSLLPDLETASRDALYLRDKPRGVLGNIKVAAEKPAKEMVSTVEGISHIAAKTNVIIQPKGYEIESFAKSSVQDDIQARGATVKKRVTLTLGLAPVLMDESVTNDSAALEQRKQMHHHMQAITRHLWAQHLPLLRLLARPGELAAGLHLRTDWSDVLEAEEQAAEASRLEVEHKRAKAMKTFRDAGLTVADAAERVGIDPTTLEASDGEDRDADARAVRGGLRAV